MEMYLAPLSYGVYFSLLVPFARVCSNVSDFNNGNQFLTVVVLNKVIIKLIKHFLNSTKNTQS